MGELAGVAVGGQNPLAITATGRGRYSRTNVDEHGFPVGYLMRRKQVLDIKTGDRVRAVVPEGFAAQGTHTGRIAVRANKQFRMGKVQGIPARFCRVLQLADGYDYAVVATALQG
nr:hypothetical protein [Ktedonobacter sp. SOSP1-85]